MSHRLFDRVGLLVLVASAASCGTSMPPVEEPPDDPCATADQIDGLRLNQIQVVGSHNSYRRRTYEPIFQLLKSLAASLPPEANPDSLDYDHLPLPEQLVNHRMRGLELDLFNDPDGGAYYNRQGLRFLTPPEPVASNIPELMEPGLKVLHILDLDYETHHYTFRSALQAIADWSAAHPMHIPLMIHLETKESSVADALPTFGLTPAIPFAPASAPAIDAEIRAVFADSRIITPDEVRGTAATLEAAVLAGGWPTLGASRGRVLFFMEGAAVDEYVAAFPGLVGGLVFANSQPGDPHAAVMIVNDALVDGATITDRVRAGYIVRTMADGSTNEARTGDESRKNAALASGAHVASTDYYRPDPRGNTPGSGWTNYKVKLPGGGPARTNPVTGGTAEPLRICDE